MHFRRIRTQIVVSFCLLMLLGGVLTTLLVRYTLESSLMEASRERGHAVAEIMAHQLAQPVAAGDWQKAQLLVDTESDHNAFVVLESPDGRIVSSAAGASPAPREALAVVGRTTAVQVELAEGLALSVPAKIDGGRLGVVHVGVSLAPVAATTAEVVRDVAGTTLGAMLAGILGIFFLSGLITRPVTSLMEAARRMGEGKLDERAPVAGRDELAQLATTFNEMADEIRTRIRASDELRAYYERILDHLTKGVLVLSADGRVEYANAAARGAFGAEPGDPLSSSFTAGAFGSTVAPESLKGGAGLRRTVKLEDGRSFAVAAALLPRPGHEASVVISAADVTELSALHDRLRRAERIAAVGEIASGIVHAINNPLDGVRRALELAARHGDEPGRMKQLLGYAQEGTERITHVTRHLLRFARADETESARTISPSALLAEAAEIVGLRAEERGVTVELDSAGLCPEVTVDPRAMVDVLANLLNNALDASEAGARVCAASRPSPDGGVELEVRDEGAGIPDDVRSRIFEPFFTTKDPGQGTGLGLSMAKRIVEAWGGEIDVRAGGARGTSFVVHLPAARLATEEATAEFS